MKQRNLKKKVGSLLLAVAMIVTSFPALSHEVHAAENQLPTKEQFATVEQLKLFNTNNNDGEKNPAKVYFGNNNQQWLIAGSQKGNLTLFAASPLATSQKFEPNSNQNKIYSEDWECDYTSTGSSNPMNVYPNHYGASPLRNTLKSLETSYFTGAEQVLMNDTTIYTNDTKNSNTYSTTDKLYLAYGDYNDDQYITVGTNSRDSLNNGLRIDKNYWENSGGTFWLRAPDLNFSHGALAAWPGYSVSFRDVRNVIALVPAFELNLSSVIFASAAPAASSEGKLSVNDAFTLRHQSQVDIGTATISQSKGSIVVTAVTNENTYLVVQNSDGAWAKKVSSNDLVFAGDIDSSLTSFENCKVWLETTTDNITYATESSQGKGYNVKVNVGENLTISGGNILQTNVSADITEITIKANDGYYLPKGYIDSIQGLNGLNVKDVTQTDFTILGTPTSDVSITLPAATVLPKADTPEIKTTQTANSITVEVTNYKSDFGEIEYNWNNVSWTDQSKLVNIGANKAHTVSVRFKGQGIYQMSDEKTVDVSTVPATYEISIPMTVFADDEENRIGIDGSKDFDLGYNGKVNVKIQNTDTMNNGDLSLTRANGNNETITSKLLVGGNPFTDLSQNVATFTDKSAPSVPFVFQRPATSNILAGTYKGTVVFDISYSED